MSDATPAPESSGVKHLLLAVAGYLLLLMLFHDAAVWGGVVFCGGDLINHELPRRAAWATQPLLLGWNPWLFGGIPYFADIQAGVLYPPKWLFRAGIAPERVATWLTLGHLLWGALGFRRLAAARCSGFPAFLAGALWMCGGYCIMRVSNGVIILTLGFAWVGWMWREAEDLGTRGWRAALMLAMLGALQFLAGAPQVVYLTWFGLGIWAVGLAAQQATWRERAMVMLRYGAAAALTGVLVAPQLIASAQYSSLAVARGADSVWKWLTADSLHPRLLIAQLAPEFFDAGNVEETYWGSPTGFHETCAYVGISALVLALYSWLQALRDGDRSERREAIVSGVLCMVGLVLALGYHTPVYRLCYAIFPGFDLFRVPSRWLLWVAAPLTLWAARGAGLLARKSLQSAEGGLERRDWVTWGIAAGVLLLACAILRAATPTLQFAMGLRDGVAHPDAVEHLRTTGMQSTGWALFVAAATAALGLVALARPGLRKATLGLLVVIALVDLLRFWQPYRLEIPHEAPHELLISEAPFHRIDADAFSDYFYPESPTVEYLEGRRNSRVAALNDLMDYRHDEFTRELYADRLAWRGIENLRGYQPLQLASFFRELNSIHALDFAPEQLVGSFLFLPIIADRTMVDAYNVGTVLTFSDATDGAQPEAELQAVGLVKARVEPFGMIVWNNPNAAGWAWLSTDSSWPGLDGRTDEARVVVENRDAESMTLSVHAPAPGMSVHASMTEYPGWSWTATNAAGEVTSGEGRSAKLDWSGDGRVEFRFGFIGPIRIAFGVAGAAWLLALGALARMITRTRQQETG